MHGQPNRRSVSGNIYLQPRAKGAMWYWRIRLPYGGEERKVIGPAWSGAGRIPDGFFTRRTAQAALDAYLTDLRRGFGIASRSGATFRDDAEAWFSNGKIEGFKRGPWKPSTIRDNRSTLDRHLLPAFGSDTRAEFSAKRFRQWRTAGLENGTLTRRQAQKCTSIAKAIFAHALRDELHVVNPLDRVEPIKVTYNAERFDFYTVEEVWALVREAERESLQDAAIYLTAAFTGCRMGEVLALRIRDADFAASALRIFGSVDHVEGVGTVKNGRGRTVPMVDHVGQALARTISARDRFTDPDDFIFVGVDGRYLDGSALRRRYRETQRQAKLRSLRFHDLRHTFASLAITQAESIRELQDWLGHADARTTARYTHYKPRTNEAARLDKAFAIATAGEVSTREAA